MILAALAGRTLLYGVALGHPAEALADILCELGPGAVLEWYGAELVITDEGLGARWPDGGFEDITTLALAAVTAAAGLAHGSA